MGPRGDYGQVLVELIRQTISPEFWDVNGGPGVILYYRPGHALVVRATGDVHARIGGTGRRSNLGCTLGVQCTTPQAKDTQPEA